MRKLLSQAITQGLTGEEGKGYDFSTLNIFIQKYQQLLSISYQDRIITEDELIKITQASIIAQVQLDANSVDVKKPYEFLDAAVFAYYHNQLTEEEMVRLELEQRGLESLIETYKPQDTLQKYKKELFGFLNEKVFYG